MKFILPFLTLCALAACAPAAPRSTISEPNHARWLSPLGRDHPLAGKVWEPGPGRFLAVEEALARLAGADIALLGETHDNADHHRFQALIVESLIGRGKRPAVAFEMIDRDLNPRIALHLALDPKDGAGLGEAVGWANRGWPNWTFYRPIAQAALDAGLPVKGANLPRALTRASTQPDGLGAEWSRLGLETPLPEPLLAALKRDLNLGHCGMLPEQSLEPMTRSQRARDGAMALTLAETLEAGEAKAAVLIAGAGHARTDYAVPYHLRRLAPDRKILSLALVEVRDGETDPRGYGSMFDLVWFTARANDTDHCADLAKRMKKKADESKKE
jgi:uncharacterized iron-regulated protein